MTDREESAFERELQASLGRLAPSARGDLLSRVIAAVAETDQRRSALMFAAGRSTLGWSRIGAFGAVAVVALVVGVIIGTSPLMRQGETSTPSPTPAADASPSASTGPDGWREPPAYTFVMESSCGWFGGRFLITVEDGEVTAVSGLDGNTEPVDNEHVGTLGELMQAVERARSDRDAEVTLRTDPVDGHPVEVAFDMSAGIDDESCYLIESYVASASPDPPPWREPTAYGFNLASRCGQRNLNGTYAITVRDGEVTAVDHRNGRPLHRVEADIPTMQDLLNRAHDAQQGGVAEVTLTVDPVDGHPLEVIIDWRPDAIDNEACFYVIEDYTPSDPES
jgi:hypothetical protein